MDKITNQRKNRLIEGHPARKSMLDWNNSEKGKEVRKKYLATEKAKKTIKESKASGGSAYISSQKHRERTRKIATQARKKWSVEDATKVLELVSRKYSSSEIGAILGRSIQSIEHKRNQLKRLNNDR